MLILAIETATQSVGVALANELGVVAHLEVRQGRRHAETVVPAVEQLLAHAEASMADITRIAVDVGPGLFTGLRVGVATAKAYALALDVPVVAISSLELVAYEAVPIMISRASLPSLSGEIGGVCNAAEASTGSDAPPLRFGAVIDARRKELYAAVFEATLVDGQIICKQTIPTFVAKPLDVRESFLSAGASIVAGDGATVYPGAFDGFTLLAASPRASILSERALFTEGIQADEIELDYIRAPDAEINWVTR